MTTNTPPANDNRRDLEVRHHETVPVRPHRGPVEPPPPAGDVRAAADARLAERHRLQEPVVVEAREEAERWRGRHQAALTSGRAHQAMINAVRADRAYELALAVPHGTRKRRQEWLPQIVKAALVVGDSVVLGAMWWRAGQPLPLALTAGLSTGLVMVMTGSMTGRESQIVVQRRRRGPRPPDLPSTLSDLFSDGSGRLPWWWILICGLLGAAALAAVTMIGLAVGDRTGLAVAAGLFAAMTLVGSAAVEAYGTNPAADLVAQRARERAAAIEEVEAIEELGANHTAAAGRAQALEHRIRGGVVPTTDPGVD